MWVGGGGGGGGFFFFWGGGDCHELKLGPVVGRGIKILFRPLVGVGHESNVRYV